jgi:hypothetical protein
MYSPSEDRLSISSVKDSSEQFDLTMGKISDKEAGNKYNLFK